MEETSAISMELVLAALIALAVLLLLGWYILNSKIQSLSADVKALQKERDDLQARLNAAEEKLAAAPASPAAASSPVESAEPAVQEVAETVAEEPVQTAPVEEPETDAIEDVPSDSEIPPEVVAVIMAAVAACGYSPAAIRSIRRDTTRPHQSRGWVMAGRLAGMR